MLYESQFYNLNKIKMSLNAKKKNCLYFKGSIAMCINPSEGKTMYTVLFCKSASRKYLPPYIIFKEKGNNFSSS